MAERPLVGIVMGSDSDLPAMEEAAAVLKGFGIPHEITISSAHRTPDAAARYAKGAHGRGLKVIIAAAGLSAHLAGFIAAQTTLPVIGVPMDAGTLGGLDALLSTVQMPGGVPVATMAIGKTGARNAGVFACQILAASDERLRAALAVYKKGLAKEVEDKARKLKARGQA
ncbi:MAG: 5-(carboxyamino)imidazole ribonucleotide mutase [Deltaproteobacteria bacterium]|nr:5-(carboxyamino)imidazole ribonucleotide mutase [Deltaproteobacteria bacterium]